jgi:hypothetical protein
MIRIKSSISLGFIGPPNDATAIITIIKTFNHLRFIDTVPPVVNGLRVKTRIDVTLCTAVQCGVGSGAPVEGGLQGVEAKPSEEGAARMRVRLRFAADDSSLQRAERELTKLR